LAFSLFVKQDLALLTMLASDFDPPTSGSQVAGISGMHHYVWPFIFLSEN
jgi:hypothetical protein